MRYYVEQRDPAFESKMIFILRRGGRQQGMVTIAYDKKLAFRR